MLLAACGPTFNWRDVAIPSTALVALFPCKPDDAERTVAMAGEPQTLSMRSCKAGGVTFAVGHTRLKDAAQAAAALSQWREATLAGLGPQPAEVSLQLPADAPALPQLLALQATRDPALAPAQRMSGLWFARGPDLFVALAFAPELPAEATEPFFSGLRLR